MLKIVNVDKNFKDKSVLKKINLKFYPGKVTGIFGNNGVGKTTLLKIIFNDFEPSKGYIIFNGTILSQADYLKMYFFTENNEMPKNMTVKQYCKYNLKLRYFKKIDYNEFDKLKWIFDYNKLKKVKTESLSAGEKKLLSLFLLFIINPEIIFFDEPTANLDSNNKKILTAAIKHLKSMNKTLVIITHLVNEVADLIDEVVIIKKGTVAFNSEGRKIADLKKFVDSAIVKVNEKEIIGRLKNEKK